MLAGDQVRTRQLSEDIVAEAGLKMYNSHSIRRDVSSDWRREGGGIIIGPSEVRLTS